MAAGDKLINVDKMFSVGFIQDKGMNKTPDQFADDLRNIRIKNWGITQRPWKEELYDWATANAIQWITSNNDRLYVVNNARLVEVNYTADPITITDRWALTGLTSTTKCNFINYGIYTIILTGIWYPFVWDWSSLTQLTSTNIDVNSNPQFWTRFAGFTVVNSQVNKNAILISNPISLAVQTNAYDWNGASADSITYDGNVLWVVGTLNNLWIFTSTTIERMDKSNLSTVWDVASLYSIPLARGQELMNENCIVPAWDVIFFLTKNKKIWVINYQSTVAEPSLKIISDIDINSIDWYMQDQIDEDQTGAFWIFDSVNNLAKFFIKSRESTVNDVCIIYDIQRNTWLKDNNKFYSSLTMLNNQLYAGSALDYRVYKDEYGSSDAWDAIEWYFETTDQVYWTPRQQKQFRGASIAWQINSLANIRRQILIDDTLVFDKVIVWENIAWNIWWLGIGGMDIWWTPIWWEMYSYQSDLVPFERIIDWASLRSSGKKVKMIFSDDSVWWNFVLDFLSLVIRPRVRENIQDKM